MVAILFHTHVIGQPGIRHLNTHVWRKNVILYSLYTSCITFIKIAIYTVCCLNVR